MLEAAIAAVYLEHGFEAMEPALVEAFSERIEYARSSHVDYKTELQETLARRSSRVGYEVVEIAGSPHERMFTCAAVIDGEQRGVGSGPSKKVAEQAAARQALERVLHAAS